MSTTFESDRLVPAADPALDSAQPGPVFDLRRPSIRRQRWALWGAVAGVLGFVATTLTDTHRDLKIDDDKNLGVDVLSKLDHTTFHIGLVAGFFSMLTILIAAAGWRRWASERAGRSLAARVIPMALTASAGAMMLGYGFKGSLAIYLPGGMDHNLYRTESLYPIYMFLDFGPYVVWWGAAVAAGAMVWLAFRERLVARWMGAVSALFFLVPVGMMVATGLPGFPGVVDPAWLVIVSLGMALSRKQADVS